MGTGASKSEPEVHVVVLQNKDGSIDAQIVKRGKQDVTDSDVGTDSSRVTVQDLRTHHHHPPPQRRSMTLNSRPHLQQREQNAIHRHSRERQSHRHHHSRERPPHHQEQNSPIRSVSTGQSSLRGHNSPSQQKGTDHSDDSSQGTEPVASGGANNSNMEFKIFRTVDNEEYTCYVRDDGNIFYVDWEQQKWRVFPQEWKESGNFEDYNQTMADQSRVEREGELIHPFRGKMITLLRQESLNVMYFFDEKTKGWLPLPLMWERHAPFTSGLVAEIKGACSDWKDDRSIVASLRQCNYSKDEVVSFYYAINDEGVFDRFKDPSSGQSVLIEKLQKQIKELEGQLSESEQNKKLMNKNLAKLTDEVENLRDENKRLKNELSSIKHEQRKQSVNLRNSFGHGALRIPPNMALKLNVMKPLVQGAWRETRTIKLKLQSTKQIVVKGIKGHNDQMNKLSKAVELLLRNYRLQSSEIEEARALYRKEAQKRKLLYNEVQELRGNIRVFCRCRYDDRDKCALKFDGEDGISCFTSQGREKKFEFERVYDPSTSQEKVFEDTCPIITSCVDGYNVCILAYGQTGAGKTYTMMGPKDHPGVNMRSIKELFNVIRERDNINYQMKISMMEVYNESIYNLLVSSTDVHEKLTIQQKGKEIIVVGSTEIEVRSIEDVMRIIATGEKNRTTASTKMNTNSSRSHLLVGIHLEGYNRVSGVVTKGRLTLVDLAGSERISRSEATGIRLVEAAAINKSLSALGQVFAAIRDSALHIPYRNSKLTHLLQPCLGGDAKACMFVNVSPLVSNMAETLSTLEFGSNARQVALGRASKNITRH